MPESYREGWFQRKHKVSWKIKSYKKSKFIYFAFIIALMRAIGYGMTEYPKWVEAHSGIPDLVSSFAINNDYHLNVIANSSGINNKEDFARQIIHMCQEDSFQTIRFAADIYGYPSNLDINVYLNRKALEKGEAICKIKFSTDDFNGVYDIKNDADKFHLYVNGEEIAFY